MAAVLCASFRRRAMVWRNFVIRTRSSRAASASGDGARAAAGASAWADAVEPEAMASITSPFRIWPRLPEPETASAETPLSAIILPPTAPAACRRAPCPCRPCRPRNRRRGLRLFLRRGGFLLFVLRRRRSRRAFTFVQHAEQRVDLDRVAFLRGDLAKRSGGRRRHFQRHLVGFQFDQRLAVADGVADILEPLADRCLGDGFAQRGYADFCCHCSVFPARILGFRSCRHSPSASSR
jgi:hypothetical protein